MMCWINNRSDKVKEIRLASNKLEEKLKGKTDEGVKDVKTEGDTQSHRAIVYGLAKAFPGLKVNFENIHTDKSSFMLTLGSRWNQSGSPNIYKAAHKPRAMKTAPPTGLTRIFAGPMSGI
jgi:3'-phosphoadenosine 5'-phosphosulfate (PAPS) 3'-phosphatase